MNIDVIQTGLRVIDLTAPKMKMRFSVKALIVAFTIACLLMAWRSRLSHLNDDLLAAGATVSFQSESPALMCQQRSYTVWIADAMMFVDEDRHSIAKTKVPLAGQFKMWMFGRSVVAVELPFESVNDEVVKSLAAIRDLRIVMLQDLHIAKYPKSSPLRGQLERIRESLPNVDVVPETEKH